MKLLTGARQTGKTLALVHYAKTNGCVIVCPNDAVKRCILSECEKHKIQILEPILMSQYMNMKGASIYYLEPTNHPLFIAKLTLNRTQTEFKGKFVFEELDLCLATLGIYVDCATGTIPTLHPQQYIVGSKLRHFDNCYTAKDFTERVLGEWYVSKEDKKEK